MFIYHIYICTGGDINAWKKPHLKFPALQKLNIEECEMSIFNLDKFQRSLNLIDKLWYLKFNDMTYQLSDQNKIFNPFQNIIPIFEKGQL